MRGPEPSLGHGADQHAPDVHLLDPVAAHHQRREVTAAGEHQADAAARQRCRGAEHQRHEPRGAVGRGRVQHRRVEQLQQPHRVVLHAAQREHRLADPARAHRGVDTLAAHVAQ